MRIATLADANGLAVSPHFLPELHIHLAAASRNATWIEHFPLIDALLGQTLSAKDGHVEVPDRPGYGMIWNYDALQRFTVAKLDSGARPS